MGIPFHEIGPFIFIRTHNTATVYSNFITISSGISSVTYFFIRLFDYCYCNESFVTEGISSIW